MLGRVVGRASGSLRRIRMEAEAMQMRAAASGNPELLARRQELRGKVEQLRAIQSEAASLLHLQPTAFLTGSAVPTAPSSFTDEELARALNVDPSALRAAAPSIPGTAATAPQSATHAGAAPLPRAAAASVQGAHTYMSGVASQPYVGAGTEATTGTGGAGGSPATAQQHQASGGAGAAANAAATAASDAQLLAEAVQHEVRLFRQAAARRR